MFRPKLGQLQALNIEKKHIEEELCNYVINRWSFMKF
jgi:hypothetical protein